MSGSEPLAVVALHGVGYRDARATAERVRARHIQSWTRHVAVGMGVETDRLALDFAYYAPLLHSGRAVQGLQDTDDLQDPLALELMAAWLTEMGAPRPVTQGAMTMPLRYAASWVAEKFSLDGRLTELFIRVFFREVAIYLAYVDSPARAAVREEVAARIARHRPRVVLAHSLGSVVAYEALHAYPELQVELLVTMGSPLALPHGVYDRLNPAPTGVPPARLGVRPASVARWVNIADPGDPVAIPPRLARAFTGVTDVTNPIHPAFGFHHAKNYLSCKATAATLAPYLGLE